MARSWEVAIGRRRDFTYDQHGTWAIEQSTLAGNLDREG